MYQSKYQYLLLYKDDDLNGYLKKLHPTKMIKKIICGHYIINSKHILSFQILLFWQTCQMTETESCEHLPLFCYFVSQMEVGLLSSVCDSFGKYMKLTMKLVYSV